MKLGISLLLQILVTGILLLPVSTRAQLVVSAAPDWNAVILANIRKMPTGGGYATTSEASSAFRASCKPRAGGIQVDAETAKPSYCSSATYLLLLRVLDDAVQKGAIQLDPSAIEALLPAALPDGHGVWGRWNANGPGTAGLFSELNLGPNFTDIAAAKPGDFLKIFWTDAVGMKERGHLVVFLGKEVRPDGTWIRFWSSNKPGGYGEKAVHESKIARMIFSRLTHPERFARAARLPKVDPYLSTLTKVESSFREAVQKTGATPTP